MTCDVYRCSDNDDDKGKRRCPRPMSLGIGAPQWSRCSPHPPDNVFPSFAPPPSRPPFLAGVSIFPSQLSMEQPIFFSLSAHFTGQVCRFVLPSSSRLGLEVCIPITLQHSCATIPDARCWTRGMYWYTWTPRPDLHSSSASLVQGVVSRCAAFASHRGSTDLAAVSRKLDRTCGSESDQVRTGECRETAMR